MYTKAHFPNQKPNEHIVLFMRRHWIILLRWYVMSAVLLAAPLIIYFGAPVIQSAMAGESVYALAILFFSAYYLFVFLFLFNNYLNYYLDVWIVTNERIISLEQRSLFSRVFSENELDMVQDVTATVHGFLATMLDYGDVQIQTAAEQERFLFKQIPHADDVARKISNLMQACEHGHGHEHGNNHIHNEPIK